MNKILNKNSFNFSVLYSLILILSVFGNAPKPVKLDVFRDYVQRSSSSLVEKLSGKRNSVSLTNYKNNYYFKLGTLAQAFKVAIDMLLNSMRKHCFY